MRGQIVHRGGVEYRVLRLRSSYDLAIRCDCALGPHWHELGRLRYRRDVDAAIADHVPEVGRPEAVEF